MFYLQHENGRNGNRYCNHSMMILLVGAILEGTRQETKVQILLQYDNVVVKSVRRYILSPD